MLNFMLFKNLLPFQAELGRDVVLGHFGLGVVIHPHVTIGDGVKIWQHVTIASETLPGSTNRVFVGDGVMIGAGATIVARKAKDLTIGAGAKIGAGAVVTSDVPARSVMVGVPARSVGTMLVL